MNDRSLADLVPDGRAREGDRHADGAVDAVSAARGTRGAGVRPVVARDDLLRRVADEPGKAEAIARALRRHLRAALRRVGTRRRGDLPEQGRSPAGSQRRRVALRFRRAHRARRRDADRRSRRAARARRPGRRDLDAVARDLPRLPGRTREDRRGIPGRLLEIGRLRSHRRQRLRLCPRSRQGHDPLQRHGTSTRPWSKRR